MIQAGARPGLAASCFGHTIYSYSDVRSCCKDCRRLRAHAAPDGERFGSLLHQHAQAVAHSGAVTAAANCMNTVGLLAVHHIQSQCFCGKKLAGGTGGRSPARLAEVALMTMSKRPASVAEAAGATARRRGELRRPAHRRWRGCGWRSPVRAGAAPAAAACTPRAAPPAPSSSTRLPAIGTPALRTMSLTRPAPSVLSPAMPPSRETERVDGAGGARARGQAWWPARRPRA